MNQSQDLLDVIIQHDGSTYEFQIGVGASTDIGLLVTTGRCSASVCLTILRQFRGFRSSDGGSWTGRLGPLGLQSGRDNLQIRNITNVSNRMTISLWIKKHSNLRWQMEIIPQILDALVGEIPVIVAPSKLLSDISTRLQRL